MYINVIDFEFSMNIVYFSLILYASVNKYDLYKKN